MSDTAAANLATRVAADADEVIALVSFSADYLDCFRVFAFDPEPDYALALCYLESAADVVQDALDSAVQRGHVHP